MLLQIFYAFFIAAVPSHLAYFSIYALVSHLGPSHCTSSARMVPWYRAQPSTTAMMSSNLHCNCSICVWGAALSVWCLHWNAEEKIIVICGENIQCTIYFCAKPQQQPHRWGRSRNSNFCHSTSFSLSINVCGSSNNHNFIFLPGYCHINVILNGPETS